MYYDPDWIFTEKPSPKQYPNITGLMDGTKPGKKKKKQPQAAPVQSMGDVFRMEPIQQSEIPTNESVADKLKRKKIGFSTIGVQYPGGFKQEYSEMITPKLNQYNDIASNTYDSPLKISDTKYNIRNNLPVDPNTLKILAQISESGKFSPEQRVLLAAIANNESELGLTRDLLGINDLYMDFGSPDNMQPDSYEANTLRKYYGGDLYSDLAGYVRRKTKDFTDLNRWNPGMATDPKFGGESYQDRIRKHVEILMNNPQILQSLFNGDVPQLDFSFLNN